MAIENLLQTNIRNIKSNYVWKLMKNVFIFLNSISYLNKYNIYSVAYCIIVPSSVWILNGTYHYII